MKKILVGILIFSILIIGFGIYTDTHNKNIVLKSHNEIQLGKHKAKSVSDSSSKKVVSIKEVSIRHNNAVLAKESSVSDKTEKHSKVNKPVIIGKIKHNTVKVTNTNVPSEQQVISRQQKQQALAKQQQIANQQRQQQIANQQKQQEIANQQEIARQQALANQQKQQEIARQQALAKQQNNSSNLHLVIPDPGLYVNGYSQESQLVNTPYINNLAQQVAGNGSAYSKALNIYIWIARNINYNTNINDSMISTLIYNSSTVHTLNTGEAICSGYANLYSVMAKDVGLKNKVLGGTYSGVGHAWNAVYTPSTGWIQVDCSVANAFTRIVENHGLPFRVSGITTNGIIKYVTPKYDYAVNTEDGFNSALVYNTHNESYIISEYI